MLKNLILSAAILGALAAAGLPAAPVINSVNRSADQVGRYAKLELTVDLKGDFTNAYNPDEIALWAELTSPTRKPWKINGFFDGTNWKIRFAANETGDWSYLVKAKDGGGSSQPAPGNFTCIPSTNHGWIKIAPNHRYLSYDDGTSFYGVGVCYPWANTTNGFDQMQSLGFNIYVYWNGTYDRNGGENLIESMASGLGNYDQRKCARLDNLLNWSEERGLGMILVIWPHDYLSENMRGWPSGWSKNPYQTITSSGAFYGDTNAWAYQEKMYRYIIARWGYSPALAGWQTVDEISGTSGWTNNRAVANAWDVQMAAYFQTNDPFKHPTTASHGDFWAEGDRVNDLSNTEIYRNYSLSNITSTSQKLWNGYAKPSIMGEMGLDRSPELTHRKIWAGLASGLSVTPLLWSFNQGWSAAIAPQYAPFEKFIAGINFAGLASPAQAKVAVPDADAFGITSDQLTFGWITGGFSGKSVSFSGLRNGGYRLEWWDCAAGTAIATNTVTAADGSLSAVIPATEQPDLAYKLMPESARAKPGVQK